MTETIDLDRLFSGPPLSGTIYDGDTVVHGPFGVKWDGSRLVTDPLPAIHAPTDRPRRMDVANAGGVVLVNVAVSLRRIEEGDVIMVPLGVAAW